MQTNKWIGNLLITGAIGVMIPYTILTVQFHYPSILRETPENILISFYAGGSNLIFAWLAFALLGLPLLAAYIQIGQSLKNKSPWVSLATTLGVISGIVQIIALLRWVFVIPVLANDFVHTNSVTAKESILTSFKLIHQFGGVLLGEHIGQLFTISWTVIISSILQTEKIIPGWVKILGYGASGIYLFAQTELLATVIPGFPVVGWAGFAGSTLWLIWLILTGIRFSGTADNVPYPLS